MGIPLDEARRLGLGHFVDEIEAESRSGPRATKPDRDAMNGLERKYASHLEIRKLAGEVWRYDFQPEKLRLADRTWYEPDFRVILENGVIEYHEVKGGHMEDDAAVKLKVVAEQHPYPFVLVRWLNERWVYVRILAKKR
jgi:hypothetical protein